MAEQITTAEGLAALPEGTEVVDRDGGIGVVAGGTMRYPETAWLSFEYVARHYGPFRLYAEPGSATRRLRDVVADARECITIEGEHRDQSVRVGLTDLDALTAFVEQAVRIAEQHDPDQPGCQPRHECVCHLCVLVREAGWLNQRQSLLDREGPSTLADRFDS